MYDPVGYFLNIYIRERTYCIYISTSDILYSISYIFAASDSILFFLWMHNILLCIHTIFYQVICWWTSRIVHILAILNSAITNMDTLLSLWCVDIISSECVYPGVALPDRIDFQDICGNIDNYLVWILRYHKKNSAQRSATYSVFVVSQTSNL